MRFVALAAVIAAASAIDTLDNIGAEGCRAHQTHEECSEDSTCLWNEHQYTCQSEKDVNAEVRLAAPPLPAPRAPQAQVRGGGASLRASHPNAPIQPRPQSPNRAGLPQPGSLLPGLSAAPRIVGSRV